MELSSYFYCDVEFEEGREPSWLLALNDYSQKNQKRIYVMRSPVTDTEDVMYDINFLLMIVGKRLCVVQQSDNDAFNDYYEDTIDSIRYLYRKYNYRNVLGLFSELSDKLIVKKQESCLNDLDELLAALSISEAIDVRRSELLVSLCIGNPNEIDKVGDLVPQNILDKVKHKIQLFDGDQTRFIYKHLEQPIVRIQGLSGTGKTELLLHKVKDLYLENEHNTIFFTCHNRILAAKLHDRIEKFFNDMKVNTQIAWDKRLWCTNAWGRSMDYNSGLYRYICYRYDIAFQGYSYAHSFNTFCKEALEKLNDMSDFKPILDYIIIDESQDFDESFFELCEKVCRKQVYLAGDVFQSIFAEHIEKAYDADYLLGKCYRTAPDTLMFAHALGLGLFEKQRYRWLNENDWKTCGYTVEMNQGSMTLSREPVRRFDDDDESYESMVLYRSDSDKFADDICGLIRQIKNETNNQVQPEDIAVIFLDDSKNIYNRANILEMKVLEQLGWDVNKAYETKEVTEGKLFISNRYNSKGLEFPYVLCVTDGILNNHNYRNSIYTMLTRSFIKSYLIVCGENATIPQAVIDGWNQIKTSHKMTIQVPSEEEQQDIQLQFTKVKSELSLKEMIEHYAKANNIPEEKKEEMADVLKAMKLDTFDVDQINHRIEMVAGLVLMQ